MALNELQLFLADDDIDDREIFMDALQEINPLIKCVTAQDGCEALQFFKNNETFIPNFIFLDFNMPKINGKQCLLELVKIERIKNVPIYLYTTFASYKDKAELINAGAMGIITKPSSIRDLIKILSEIILSKQRDLK